jgi:hypothetical protein
VRGQIYIPEVNWCLMALGVALILGFTLTQPDSAPVNTAELGSAFGERPPSSASSAPALSLARMARCTSCGRLVPHSQQQRLLHANV